MEYKIKPLNLEVNGVEEVKFPDLKDRIIEMRGQVVEITLNGLENTRNKRKKAIKELEAKSKHEKAKIENIESFHPFVKEMEEKDLHTVWMYYQSKAIAKGCDEEIDKLKGWIETDDKELQEIYKQIPELNPVLQEAKQIIDDAK